MNPLEGIKRGIKLTWYLREEEKNENVIIAKHKSNFTVMQEKNHQSSNKMENMVIVIGLWMDGYWVFVSFCHTGYSNKDTPTQAFKHADVLEIPLCDYKKYCAYVRWPMLWWDLQNALKMSWLRRKVKGFLND